MKEILLKYAKLFFIALPLLIAFDASWIGVIAGPFYHFYLGALLAPEMNYYAAALFYIFYVGAMMYFAILPALKEKSFPTAFIQGAALGFACYMAYDLTNLATLPTWPLMVVVLDIAWGSIMTACVSALTYLLAAKLYGVAQENTVV